MIWTGYRFQQKTKTELAKEYNVSVQRISQIIHKVGFLFAQADYFEAGV